MNFYTFCKIAAPRKMFENAGSTHSRPAQRLIGGAHCQRPARPGQIKAGLDPGVGAATTSRASRGATAARGGTAKRSRSGAGEARTGWRGWRRASPATWMAGNDDEGAARRDPAAAGGGERRRPCAVREEPGLGVESSEGREEMLPAQGIEK